MLLKPSEPWNWTEYINNMVEEAKKVIAEKVEEGVKLYDPKLHTGLMNDWCQDWLESLQCGQQVLQHHRGQLQTHGRGVHRLGGCPG